MDLYEINSEGALYIEKVSTLPIWHAIDEGRILYDENTNLLYFADSSRWTGAGAFESGTVMLFGNTTAPIGWTRKTDWQDNAMFCFSATGTPGNGGNVNPQSAHTHSAPSHTHTMQNHTHATTGHQLTISEMPSHNHTYVGSHEDDHVAPSSSGDREMDAQTKTTGSRGGNQEHSHGDTGAPSNNTTSTSSAGTTGGNILPYYQEILAAQKD